MLWRPVVAGCLLAAGSSVLSDPDEAVGAVLVMPLAFLVLAVVAAMALPSHFIARRVLDGKGSLRSTMLALLWATLPSGALGLLTTIILEVMDALPEDSITALALAFIVIAVALAAVGMQVLLSIHFTALAHALPASSAAVAVLGGVLSTTAILVTLVLAIDQWDAVAIGLAWLACIAPAAFATLALLVVVGAVVLAPPGGNEERMLVGGGSR